MNKAPYNSLWPITTWKLAHFFHKLSLIFIVFFLCFSPNSLLCTYLYHIAYHSILFSSLISLTFSAKVQSIPRGFVESIGCLKHLVLVKSQSCCTALHMPLGHPSWIPRAMALPRSANACRRVTVIYPWANHFPPNEFALSIIDLEDTAAPHTPLCY